jgi:hypothetical protein
MTEIEESNVVKSGDKTGHGWPTPFFPEVATKKWAPITMFDPYHLVGGKSHGPGGPSLTSAFAMVPCPNDLVARFEDIQVDGNNIPLIEKEMQCDYERSPCSWR